MSETTPKDMSQRHCASCKGDEMSLLRPLTLQEICPDCLEAAIKNRDTTIERLTKELADEKEASDLFEVEVNNLRHDIERQQTASSGLIKENERIVKRNQKYCLDLGDKETEVIVLEVLLSQKDAHIKELEAKQNEPDPDHFYDVNDPEVTSHSPGEILCGYVGDDIAALGSYQVIELPVRYYVADDDTQYFNTEAEALASSNSNSEGEL